MSRGSVFIRSAGQVTAAGTGVPQLVARLGDHAWHPELGLDRPDALPLPVATCSTFTTQGFLPPLVARRLDRPARLLAVAAREAMAASGAPLPWSPARIGVSAASGNAGTEALFQVLTTVFQVGPAEAPPMQFPSTVANAPASQLAIIEKLAGPNVTFAEKQVGGLRALVEAGRLLRRGRADAMIAAAVDEAQWLNAESYDRLGALRRADRAGFVLGEGAVALLIAREHPGVPCARLAGLGASSSPTTTYSYPTEPGALVRAIESALDSAELAAGDIELVMSMANGAPALVHLESASLARIFGRLRPATVAITERVGEGSFASLLRVLVATLVITGEATPAWGLPAHLAAAGFALPQSAPRTALIAGVAGGGSAIAVILTLS